MDFSDMLMEAMVGPKEADITMKPEDQAEILLEANAIIQAGCRFKVGDIVTQTKEYEAYNVPKIGDPAVVVRVFEPKLEKDGDSINNSDMDIMVMQGKNDGGFGPKIFRVESWRFEHFKS